MNKKRDKRVKFQGVRGEGGVRKSRVRSIMRRDGKKEIEFIHFVQKGTDAECKVSRKEFEECAGNQ